MQARVGDRLIPDGDTDRIGLVIGLQNANGSPPYVIKWLSSGQPGDRQARWRLRRGCPDPGHQPSGSRPVPAPPPLTAGPFQD
jgi:Domain of unknown function (DUF1918)